MADESGSGLDWGSIAQNFIMNILLSELLRQKPKFTNPKPPGIDELTSATASGSRPVAVIFGRVMQKAPNELWRGNAVYEPALRRVRYSLLKKPVDVIEYYKTKLGIEYSLAMSGGDVTLLSIVVGEKHKAWSGELKHGQSVEVRSTWAESEIEASRETGFVGQVDFYAPPNRQSGIQNPYMAGQVTVNPAYTHLTRVVFRGPAHTMSDGQASGYIGNANAIPPIWFELRRYPEVESLGISSAANAAYRDCGSGSCNPAFALLETIVNDEWGGRYPLGLVDVASFEQAAQTLFNESHGLCMLWDGNTSVEEFIKNILGQVNGQLVEDLTTGLLRLRLIRADSPSVMNFDSSNILKVESFSRAAGADATNVVVVPYKDVDGDYKEKTARAQDLGGIRQTGQTISSTAQYPAVGTGTLAANLAARDLTAAATPLAKATLQVAIPEGTFLYLGDVVTVSLDDYAVSNLKMRVVSVRRPMRGHEWNVTLVQDVFTAASAIYGTVPNSNSTILGVPDRPNTLRLWGQAPYGLSNDESADYLLAWATPPANNSQQSYGYRLGLWVGDEYAPSQMRTILTTQWSESVSAYAVDGYVNLVPVTRTQKTSFTLLTGSSGASYARRYAGRQILAMAIQPDGITYELMMTTFTVTGSSTVTVTPSRRGCYGTVPRHLPVGSMVVLLTDYVIDPIPLPTMKDTNGKLRLASSYYGRAQSYGPGGIAPFTERPIYGDEVLGYNAELEGGDYGTPVSASPYVPAAIAINGVFGETSDDRDPPEISGSNFVLSWQPRDKSSAGYSDYESGDAAWPASATVSLTLAVPFGSPTTSTATVTSSNTRTISQLWSGTNGQILTATFTVTKGGKSSFVRARWKHVA